MQYIQYPLYRETMDRKVRAKFTSEFEGTILKHTDKRLIGRTTKLDSHRDNSWIPCPCDVNKSYYFEVIENRTILNTLMTEGEIYNKAWCNDVYLVKTGRVFEL